MKSVETTLLTSWPCQQKVSPPSKCQQKSRLGSSTGGTLFGWTVCQLRRHNRWRKPKAWSSRQVPAPAPDWTTFMQMKNPNLFNLIVSDSTILISQNHVFSLVVMDTLWLVGKNASEDVAVQLLLDRNRIRGVLYKGGLRWQESSAGVWCAQLGGFPDMEHVWEASVSNGCKTLVMNLSRIISKESFCRSTRWSSTSEAISMYFYNFCPTVLPKPHQLPTSTPKLTESSFPPKVTLSTACSLLWPLLGLSLTPPFLWTTIPWHNGCLNNFLS